MSVARRVRRVCLAGAFALSLMAVGRADAVLADPPWGWHVSTEAEVLVGMFIVPIGAVLVVGMFSLLPALPPDGPVPTDEAYEWRVTAIVLAVLSIHVWALLPVFGVYLL